MRKPSIARLLTSLAIVGCFLPHAVGAEPTCWAGFSVSPWFEEQVQEIRIADEARAIVNAPLPGKFDSQKPTELVIFATPNGNTAEQTLGCEMAEGMDWHFNIQHVAAQVRLLRTLQPEKNIVLACVQPDKRSWPAWKRAQEEGPAAIDQIVRSLTEIVPGGIESIALTGHSGGGSFIFGQIDARDEIPSSINRIVMLDSNYSYDNEDQHGEKLLVWLAGDSSRQLVVLAYDDRNIEYKGKKVVSPTGGTFRASHRMLDFLREKTELEEDQLGIFHRYQCQGGRLLTLIHPNPENKILHTRLVGEMNGLLYALTVGTPAIEGSPWFNLPNVRVYTDWIQPEPYDFGK